jgi:hypothetical protein
MQRAEVLFGCYRRGDANDPERYVGSIAAVLSLYEEEIIREATDPRFGISTSEKHRSFMPNSGELKAYCDALADRKYRMEQLAKIPRPVPASHRLDAPEPASGSFANIHVPDNNPRYAKLAEWTKTADPKFWKFGPSSDGVVGLWIPLNVWQDGGAQQIAKKFAPPKDLTLSETTRAAMAARYEPQASKDAS